MSANRFPLVFSVPFSPNGSPLLVCVVYPSCVCVSNPAILHPASFRRSDILCPAAVFRSPVWALGRQLVRISYILA